MIVEIILSLSEIGDIKVCSDSGLTDLDYTANVVLLGED